MNFPKTQTQGLRRALAFGFGILVDIVQGYVAVDRTKNTYT